MSTVTTFTMATMTANVDGVSVSGELTKEESHYVAVVDGQRVDAATTRQPTVEAMVNGIRRRLPRGNPRSWGVQIQCRTNAFAFAYGNLRRPGGGDGTQFDTCVQEAINAYPREQTLGEALAHAANTLSRCCR